MSKIKKLLMSILSIEDGYHKVGAKMQDKVSADLKESFIWGYQDVNGKTFEDHPLRGANQWPKFFALILKKMLWIFFNMDIKLQIC